VASIQTGERNNSVSRRSGGVSARTISIPSGTTVPFNSVSSSDGLPVDSEAGSKTESKKDYGRRIGRIKMLKTKIIAHPLTTLWCILLPLIGIIIQGIK
jgi:hypothetical protein